MKVLNIIAIISPYILLIISGWFLKSYIPKYFEEKAKNLATKEDIGEITGIVKKVEHQFDLSLKNKESHNTLLLDSMNEYNKRRSTLLFDILSLGEQAYRKLSSFHFPLEIHLDDSEAGFSFLESEATETTGKILNEIALLKMMASHMHQETSLLKAINAYIGPIDDVWVAQELGSLRMRVSKAHLKQAISKGIKNRQDEMLNNYLANYSKENDRYSDSLSKLRDNYKERYSDLMKEIISYYDQLENQLKETH